MATDTRVFDQVYSILHTARATLRDNRDEGSHYATNERVYLTLEDGQVWKMYDMESEVGVELSWSDTNGDLRRKAREAMSALLG